MSQETEAAEVSSLLERIRGVLPLVSANAAEGESDRRVAQESIDALTEAGAFRVSVPRRYGGYDLGHRAGMEVGREVGLADGGTAWVVSLLNSGAAYSQLFSEQAQDDVFREGPDSRISLVVTPTGSAQRVPGGYRISGKWFYNSGSLHANWAIVAVRLMDGDERIGDVHALLPESDFRIDDTWFVAGMRSSGSNCLVAEDVFVPEHRTREFPIDQEHDDNGELVLRASSIPLALLGPQIGLGRAVFEAVKAAAPKKGIAYTDIERQTDSVAFQMDLAKAAQRLDTAELFAIRAAEDLDGAAAAGRQLDYVTRARVRGDIGWAVDNIVDAINILLTAHGASSFAESNPIQRFWRDQAVVARHGYVAPPLAYEIYGKALLGVPNTSATML